MRLPVGLSIISTTSRTVIAQDRRRQLGRPRRATYVTAGLVYPDQRVTDAGVIGVAGSLSLLINSVARVCRRLRASGSA
jgi:hypothetical protein